MRSVKMEIVPINQGRTCAFDDEIFERYSIGSLPEEDSAVLEEHLLICEACRQRLAREDMLTGRIRGAAMRARREELAGRPSWRFPTLVPAIAGLAVMLLLVLAALRWMQPA